jgi:hypothetical protein
VSSPRWGSLPRIYYCFILTVLFFWGARSDERTGLSSVYAAGPCQRSRSRVRVPWDLRPYFTVLDLRVPFCRLLRLAGSRWRYSTTSLQGAFESNGSWPSLYRLGTDRIENIASNSSSYCCMRVCCGYYLATATFTEPLLTNSYFIAANFAVLA